MATCISTVCWLLVFFFSKETLYLKKNACPEQQPLLVAQTDGVDPSSLKEILTPQVVAMSVIYAIVAFELLYFDGKLIIIQDHAIKAYILNWIFF